VTDLPPFLSAAPAKRSRLGRLLDRTERLEHQLRDALAEILEVVEHDDDLACECRRFLADLDR
jgi:thioredoxin-like negative regulator of GroEL